MPQETKVCRYCTSKAIYEIEHVRGLMPLLSYTCGRHLQSETIAMLARSTNKQIVTTKIGD